MADDHDATTKRWPFDVAVRSCCGQRHVGAVCPDGLVRCCLCFDRFPWDQLNQLPDGTREDVCVPCAVNDRLTPRSDHAIAMELIERGVLVKWTNVPQVYRLLSGAGMADDHDALLARLDHPGKVERIGHDVAVLCADAAEAVRDLLADRTAALDVIARLTTGWHAIEDDDVNDGAPTWYRMPVIAEDDEDIGPDRMSDREWRVYCETAQRATGGSD